MPLPNRIAVYLTGLAGLCTALAPVIADLDIESTVGLVGGFAGIAAVVHKWLQGWQNYEERTDLLSQDPSKLGVGPESGA